MECGGEEKYRGKWGMKWEDEMECGGDEKYRGK